MRQQQSASCKFPRCVSYHEVELRGENYTAESSSAVCITLWSQNRKLWWSLAAFKGTIWRNPFMGEHFYHEKKDLKRNFFYLLGLKFEFFKLCYRISQ